MKFLLTTTWTNEELKENATSQKWDDPVATWDSASYEWDGQLATLWTNESRN